MNEKTLDQKHIDFLERILVEDIPQTELYSLVGVLLKDDTEIPSDVSRLYGDIHNSTRHAAILGAGQPLDHSLLRSDVEKILRNHTL